MVTVATRKRGKTPAAESLPANEEEPVLGNLTSKQAIVLRELMAGAKYVDAARTAGVTDRAVRRWRQESPHFEAALRMHVKAIRNEAELRATLCVATAMTTLEQVASDPKHPHALKAVQMILKLSSRSKLHEGSTESRIVEAEQLLDRQYPKRH